MAHTVITVGREYGSGGRLIAQKAAEALGIPFFDRSIINMAAEETGLSADFIRRTEQQKTSSFLYNLYMSTQSLPVNDQVFIAQSEVIRRVAAEGPCIIVGRCADYVLREHPRLRSVFIHADMESRKQRVVEEYGQARQGVEQMLMQADKKRANYYDYYTDRRWGDARNYDLCVSSSRLGIDRTVELLELWVRMSLNLE